MGASRNASAIECPKCAAPVQENAMECARCGIVFAKFEQRAVADPVVSPPCLEESSPTVHDDPLQAIGRLARAAVLVGLIVWTWQFARAPIGAESVLHLPNLVFHEAGQVILGFFGRFIRVLGGSFFQFALPLALAGVFLRQRDPFGAVVCTWWAGQNLLDLAPYIADARALQLVLLGGKTGAEVEGHDWEYLLTELGWLPYDRMLGLWAYRVGLMMMTGATVWGAMLLAKHRDAPAEGSDEL